MEQDMTIDLIDLFYMIRRRAKLMICITLALTILSGIISVFVLKPMPEYELKTSFIVKPVLEKDYKELKDINYKIMIDEKMTKIYAEIARSEKLIQKTIDELSLDIQIEEFNKNYNVNVFPDTQIITLTFKSTNSKKATEILNKQVQNVIAEIKNLNGEPNILIIDEARVYKKNVKSKAVNNIIIAFVLGIMLSLGIIFILEYIDNTIKTEKEVEEILSLPVIGIIPRQN